MLCDLVFCKTGFAQRSRYFFNRLVHRDLDASGCPDDNRGFYLAEAPVNTSRLMGTDACENLRPPLPSGSGWSTQRPANASALSWGRGFCGMIVSFVEPVAEPSSNASRVKFQPPGTGEGG